MTSSKPPNPVLHFLTPVLLTVALFVWWVDELLHDYHFNHGRYQDNAAELNTLLLVFVALSWVAAFALYLWRVDQQPAQKALSREL